MDGTYQSGAKRDTPNAEASSVSNDGGGGAGYSGSNLNETVTQPSHSTVTVQSTRYTYLPNRDQERRVYYHRQSLTNFNIWSRNLRVQSFPIVRFTWSEIFLYFFMSTETNQL